MAKISDDESRLLNALIAHHEMEAAACRDILAHDSGATPRELARCRSNLEDHTRFSRDLRLMLFEANQ
jgi:hypothetical protein